MSTNKKTMFLFTPAEDGKRYADSIKSGETFTTVYYTAEFYIKLEKCGECSKSKTYTEVAVDFLLSGILPPGFLFEW